MSNVKITQLPSVSSVSNSDVFPVVASSTTSQLSVLNLANSMPQVPSSISASYAVTASYAVSASYEITYETSSSYADFAMTASYVKNTQTASYYNFSGTSIISSSAQFNNLVSPFTGSFTGSFKGDGSLLTGISSSPFPYTGNAEITGSLKLSAGSTFVAQPSASIPSQNASFGSITATMSALSGSIEIGRYLPSGYLTYYLTCDESYNGKTSIYLYPLTSNGTTIANPYYGSTITIINRATTGNSAWIIVNPIEQGVLNTKINTLAGSFPSQSLALGSYMTLFVDYNSGTKPQWRVLASGSLF